MKVHTMKFSVIIPAYNSEQFFEECLASVNGQTFRDFEIIIVDDGSGDATGAIADRFAQDFRNVTVIHKQHEGTFLARQAGLEQARGEYVVYVDSDDTLREDALEKVAAAIVRSGADIVSFERSRKSDYVPMKGSRKLKPGIYSGDRYAFIKERVCRGRFGSIWGKAIRRSLMVVENSCEENRELIQFEDLFQLLPVVDRGSSLVHLGDVLYYYRPNACSVTSRYRQHQLTSTVQVHKRMLGYARRWSASCLALATVYEALNFTSLLKRAEYGTCSRAEKEAAYDEILCAMEHEGVFERFRGDEHRLDNRLILEALKAGNISRARAVMHTVELARKVLRR